LLCTVHRRLPCEGYNSSKKLNNDDDDDDDDDGNKFSVGTL
jgi:hypothetical protein